jgi:hypothetical protein
MIYATDDCGTVAPDNENLERASPPSIQIESEAQLLISMILNEAEEPGRTASAKVRGITCMRSSFPGIVPLSNILITTIVTLSDYVSTQIQYPLRFIALVQDRQLT